MRLKVAIGVSVLYVLLQCARVPELMLSLVEKSQLDKVDPLVEEVNIAEGIQVDNHFD